MEPIVQKLRRPRRLARPANGKESVGPVSGHDRAQLPSIATVLDPEERHLLRWAKPLYQRFGVGKQELAEELSGV